MPRPKPTPEGEAEPILPRKRGRPPKDPQRPLRAMVQNLTGYGVEAPDIARVLGVSVDTLKANYEKELAAGVTITNAAAAESLLRIMKGTGREAVTAAMFWLKNRAGWSELNPKPVAAAPSPEKPQVALGKKEEANISAQSAERGTSWAALLN